jgi:23S rRNA (uracil1939-C5)-methyltransferase
MQRFGRALVAPPPGAFLQATAEGEQALLQAVALAIGSARRVVDLFAGVGTFTLPLAERAEVLAVEGEAAMMAALDKGARGADGLRRVTTQTRDLYRRPLEADEFKGVEAVVIDPPRAGAEAQMRVLAKSKVPMIAAVSCNPVTFARDARILIDGGYRLDWVQVVDQFRWSSHVELAASFSLTD